VVGQRVACLGRSGTAAVDGEAGQCGRQRACSLVERRQLQPELAGRRDALAHHSFGVRQRRR
jgi:hypothetical protein